ncbi:MAG: hypothetical protein OXH52_12965 [Gammaproteobacteria bacterium]|nr:hypothetical protein [Gammaproteobacteria bacterium]
MIDPRRPSPAEAKVHLAQIEWALHAVRKGWLPARYAVVWPAGLDRSLLHELPLSTPVRNCLEEAMLTNGHLPLCTLTLRRNPNFRRTFVADLLLTVEKYLIDCTLAPDVPTHDSPRSVIPDRPSNIVDAGLDSDEVLSEGSNAAAESLASLLDTIDRLRSPSRRWSLATEGLRSLLATSADVLGTPTLADALRPELVRLASRMGLDNALRSVALHETLLGTPSLPALVVRRLRETLNGFSPRQLAVIEARLVRSPPATLEQVARQFGVTRERVRQIQKRLEPKIDAALGEELQIIASTLQERLEPVVAADALEQRIDLISHDASETVAALFRDALIRAMGFTLNGGLYTNDHAEQAIRDVRRRARELADDVGLVQERDIVSSLPGEKWQRFWPWLRRRSGLHGFYGSLALRDSAKARAKAALLFLGRPATRDEIGAVCGRERNRVGANLSNIPSVVKADRDRWGLRDWIDDEYDGIVGEIVQRIEEDGGVTTTERLLTEIPARFNVSPQSVRAYMQTPRFDVRDGSIRLASPASIRLRNLDDVIDGRDEGGAPFWTFVVETRYFQGYSVVGVPPEFAKALGCEPDSGVDIRIENLSDCRALSLRWRLATLTGASLGYVAEPLRRLDLQTGDRARVTIAGPRSVRLGPDFGDTGSRPPQGADATLVRILGRRRAI